MYTKINLASGNLDLVQERPMEQGGACNLNLGIGAANALPNGLADRSGYEDSVYFVEIPEDEEEVFYNCESIILRSPAAQLASHLNKVSEK
ncbi:hypothetical protein SLA2020_386350 [Shorea laevis]